MPLQIFSSNRVEILYQQWKSLLYGHEIHPFQRRFVIAPSPAMKAWLQLQLAKDPDSGIAMGLEIGSIDQLVLKLHNMLFHARAERSAFPSAMEFAWMFEALLRQIIRHEWCGDEQALWRPLLEYLHPSGSNHKKNELHLLSFASYLAELFVQYGQYGCQMLDEWEKGTVHEWQARLWCLFKARFPSFFFAYQQLAHIEQPKAVPQGSMAVHVFAMSFLPPRVHAFFQAISATVPVYYYLLSPCQMFWSDLCSDRQKRNIGSFWQTKGVSETQIAELETFLNDRNVLLANLGRMGREMAQLLEDTQAIFSDLYVLPASVCAHPRYEELLTDDMLLEPSTTPLSLLQAVQADITLLCNPPATAKIDLPATDRSIQLHRAATKQREIEILYNLLVHLITSHSHDTDPILPSEIIVMAPDLKAYESAITSLFGAAESVLNFQLMEIPTTSKSSLVRGLLHLLDLGTGRWEMKTVLNLLEYPEFQHKHGFSYAEMAQIREWLKNSGIHWGQTASHRNETLKRNYMQAPGAACVETDSLETGTWEYGMGRLLMGVAVDPTQLESLKFTFDLPIEGVESGHIDLFAKWMALVNQLKKDLHPLLNESFTLKEWSLYLLALKESHFAVDPKEKEATATDLFLLTQIRAIAAAASKLPTERFPFNSIKQQLEKRLSEEKTNYREGDLQSVRFCSLLPMRAVPAKVVVLIGMGEGAFPRNAVTTSLNLMPCFEGRIYAPSQVDFDRYLFLEALLSARKYFILSYVGYSPEEQREVPPSLLARELFNYLDEGYTIDGKQPSSHCSKSHPFDAFHKSYFENGSETYLLHHYRMAIGYYKTEKTSPHRLTGNFLCHRDFSGEHDLPEEEAEDTLVTLKELENFASNPIKTYFNHKLHIYIDKKSSPAEEPFELAPLDKYQLRRDAIKAPFSEVVSRAARQGKLPSGIFKQIASTSLEQEISDMQRNLTANEIDPSNITPVTFSEQYASPHHSPEKGWMLPPLLVDMGKRKIKITGRLEEVAAQGIIFHSDRDLKQLIKLWPKTLLLLCAIEQYALPIKPQLISSKHPKPISIARQNPLSDLQTFLAYFISGSDTLSLLLPEWISALLKEKEAINKIIHAHITDEFTPFYNEYALWLFRDHAALLADATSTPWQEIALTLYGDLPTHLAL